MRKKPRGISKNFDSEVPKEYYTRNLLGCSEKERFQEYIQSEVTLFKSLLHFDNDFLKMIKYVLHQCNTLKEAIILKNDKSIDIDLILFQEMRMSDDIRLLIDESIRSFIKITTHNIEEEQKRLYIRSLFIKREYLRNELISANLRLAMLIAHKYMNYCTSFTYNDLVHEGSIGLLKSVNRFDPERGYKFSTYAAWWIRHSIQRALTDLDPLIRFPIGIHEAILNIKKIENECIINYGIANNDKIIEIAQESGLKLNEIKNAIQSKASKYIYLDAPVDDDITAHDAIADNAPNPFDNYEKRKIYEFVHSLFKFVTPMELDILKFRFGFIDNEDLTLQQIANKYDLSRERIRQIQQEALTKIRQKLKPFKKDLYLVM